MSAFEVNPGALAETGSEIFGLGSEVNGIKARLGAAVPAAATGCGFPDAQAALTGAWEAWSSILGQYAETVAGIGTATGSAADAYTTADESSIGSR